MPSLQQFAIKLRSQTIALARRMDWARGLRAATALSTPLLLADVTGLTHLGWTALGGIEAIVSDAGGPYRSRLGRLSVLSFGGALGVFLGTLAGNDLRWALPVTLLFTFVWAYLPVLGQPFASAGLLVQVIYICGVGEPDPSWREALLRASFLLAGGLWAMMLSLFLWPLDPYRPARSAVSECFEALAAFLLSVQELQADAQSAEEWHRTNTQHKIRLRKALEKAREAIVSVRAESPAETIQGRNLIVLLETADLILGCTVALAEHAEASALPQGDSNQSLRPVSLARNGCNRARNTDLEPLFLAERAIASLLIRRKIPHRKELEILRTTLNQLTLSFNNCSPEEDADTQFLARQLTEMASNLDTAVESTATVRLGIPTYASSAPGVAGSAEPEPRPDLDCRTIWNNLTIKLTDSWHFKSLSFRHAARVALVCGFDVCLIERRHVGHGYWLMLTSVVVLQPHVSGTLRRGMQRIGGTVGGGILAALLAIVLHSQVVTGVVLFPLALLALAFLPVNYSAFAFFSTPAFVLAFLRHPGDWQLAFLRIGNTIAGAAIAIAAMTVLFPTYERDRIASYLRSSLIANRRYLEQLILHWRPVSGTNQTDLALARRATGLAHNDMEESLERVLAERWTGMTSTETLLAFAAYLHRFSQSITGMALLPGAEAWKGSHEVQAALTGIHSELVAMEAVLAPPQQGSSIPQIAIPAAPDELPRFNARLLLSRNQRRHPLGERQIIRLDRQAQVMQRHLESMGHEPWLIPT